MDDGGLSRLLTSRKSLALRVGPGSAIFLFNFELDATLFSFEPTFTRIPHNFPPCGSNRAFLFQVSLKSTFHVVDHIA